jgi:glycosyltransferase involved in cell wall biosynthesis
MTSGRAAPPIKVLWAIKQLGAGGSERLLVSAARHHDHERFDIHAVYILRGNDELAPQLSAAGVTVHCLGVVDGLDPRWIPRFQHVLAQGAYDVVHVHSPLMAGVVRPLLSTLPPRRRPGLVVTEHGAWGHYHVLTRALNHITLPVGDAHLAVSEEARRSLPVWLQRGTRVVIHAVPVNDLLPLRGERDAVRAELGVAADEVVVLTVANLRPVKDYPTLLMAARTVLDRDPHVRFFAVGGGRLEDDMHALQRGLGLGYRFQLLGGRSDATRLMAGADVFVLPSREEGYPVALMEAMALGLPVVATGVGGVPEAVRDGVEGYVVPPGDPRRLADAVLRLAQDGELRARLACASGSRGLSYDVARTAQTMEAIYTEVAGRAGPAQACSADRDEWRAPAAARGVQ